MKGQLVLRRQFLEPSYGLLNPVRQGIAHRLYVAESDQVDAYDYADGRAVNGRTITAGLPDARSPDLHGAYAHALKSVAVGPDGAVYFSIGSTANVSPQDRTASPPRAMIMRIPPGGGSPQPFATGVRNGTGLAVAAVSNRDNTPDPDGRGDVRYVNDHPPESLARLTPGRELGWPYCNPDGGPANLPFVRDMTTNRDGSFDGVPGPAAGRAEHGRALGAVGPGIYRGCAAAALWGRRAGRYPRFVEPQAATGTGGVVLCVAQRRAR